MKKKSIKFLVRILILLFNIISHTLIRVPFRINQKNTTSAKVIENNIEDIIFNFKLFTLIEIGKPPQKMKHFQL